MTGGAGFIGSHLSRPAAVRRNVGTLKEFPARLLRARRIHAEHRE